MASVSALGGCTAEHRSSILEMLCKKGVIKTCKIHSKATCQGLVFNKIASLSLSLQLY